MRHEEPQLFPHDATRAVGRDAQRINIHAARAVAHAVRTTLGPKGMDKLLVDPQGNVTVTNDGVTILRELQLEHPCARMIADIAVSQERAVGDGTTTAVVLAGELLGNAERLIDDGIHPTVIAKGYRLACVHALGLLARNAKKITAADRAILAQLASTAMTGKGVEDARDHLAQIVLRAVTTMTGAPSRKEIHIAKGTGGTLEETRLIDGVILEKRPVHPAMPMRVANAKILLLDVPLEIRTTEIDARITISDPTQIKAFYDMEERMVREMVARVVATGATVVCSGRGIDDLAGYLLAKAGILAFRRLSRTELDRVSLATGASIASAFDDLSSATFGAAATVDCIEEEFVAFQGCPEPRAMTIVVCGSTPHVIAEAQRALDDAVGDVVSALRSGLVVPGAGAPEFLASAGLRSYARTLPGRERRSVDAFADALEVIPRTLAENAGLDPIDALAAVMSAHEAGQHGRGIDVQTGGPVDALAAGIIEPLVVKTHAIASATEVAVMILRIDDLLARRPAPVPAPDAPAR